MNRMIPSLAAASLFTLAAAAGAQTTGTAHPEALDDSITTAAPAQPSGDHYRKPSAAVIETAPAAAPMPAPATVVITPAAGTPALHTHAAENAIAAPNEIPIGTLLHVSLDTPLSSATARAGDHFSGHLTEDVTRDGRVLVPSGSIIRGRVTEVHASRHFLNDASLRIQPDTLTPPDGIPYPLAAQLVDFDHGSDAHYASRVSEEGNIVTNPHSKGHLAAAGLTTGTAAVAGGMIAGAPGAVIGATVGLGANAILWAKENHQQVLDVGTGLILDVDQPLVLNGTPVAAVISANRTGDE
jgi:hypothetical protein